MIKNNELCSQKSNELIQNYAWHLSEKELKIFEYLCCCVDTKNYNEEDNTITTSFREFAEACNNYSSSKGGKNHNLFKKQLQNLSDKSILIDNKNSGGIIRILSEITWNNKNDKCICYMSNSFKEFMRNFSKGYTFTELKMINRMTSKYTINLYYLVQSWSGKQKVTLDIDYLRNKLQVPKSSYDNIGKFKQILDNSVKEYNEIINYFDKLGCKISYEIMKEGKKYSSIIIYLHSVISINDSYGFCEKKPNELEFETEQEKDNYIDDWIIMQCLFNGDDEDRYWMLYSSIPDKVHNYEKNKVDAIYNVANEYANSLIKDTVIGFDDKCELLINRFNTRKWYLNYEKKVETNIYSYYLKSFECWCEQQKKFKEKDFDNYSRKLSRPPSYDIEKLKEYTANNTEI